MNLTTNYLGFELKSPLIPGASPLSKDIATVRELEDAGAGAIVMSSLFEEKIPRNKLPKIGLDEIPDLGNEFFWHPDKYIQTVSEIKAAVNIPVIASLNVTTAESCAEQTKLITQAGADALELNLYLIPTDPMKSSADVEQRMLEIVRAASSATKIPIALKLSPFFSALPNFCKQATEAGAKGLVLFNRFYQPDVSVRFHEIIPKLELSESSELLLRLRWIAIMHGRIKASLCATGGVQSLNDIIKAILVGADTVQMVSCLLRFGPGQMRILNNELSIYLDRKGICSLAELRGSLSMSSYEDPEAFERANYLQTLQLWEE